MRMPFSPFFTLRPSWFHAYNPGNAGCVGPLPCNLQNVSEAVVVKAAHRVEVGGECIGVSGLQLLDEALDVGGDDFFGGLPWLRLFGVFADGGDGGWWWFMGASSLGLAFALPR